MNSRDRILQRLRSHRRPFEDAPPRPERYLPVMHPVEGDLLARFTTEMIKSGGSVHVAADEDTATQIVLNLVGNDPAVLAWENLPLPGLVPTLIDRQIKVITPNLHGEQRATVLAEAERVRIGITGADAGIAATGTLVLMARTAQGRLPSLLPRVHIALLRRNVLFGRLEDWGITEGRTALRTSRSVVLASGPSATGDIEATSIRGVHGPGEVHVIAF